MKASRRISLPFDEFFGKKFKILILPSNKELLVYNLLGHLVPRKRKPFKIIFIWIFRQHHGLSQGHFSQLLCPKPNLDGDQ